MSCGKGLHFGYICCSTESVDRGSRDLTEMSLEVHYGGFIGSYLEAVCIYIA